MIDNVTGRERDNNWTPTYHELMQLYFNARMSVIGEHSGNIAADTVYLWNWCNFWLQARFEEPLEDTDEMVANYKEILDKYPFA